MHRRDVDMAARIQLPPEAKRGAKISRRRGYRLITPNKKRAFKVAVVAKFNSMQGTFVVLRVS